MSADPMARDTMLAGIDEARSSWAWFLFLGMLFILLGVICIAGEIATTLITILVLGWFLMLSGVVELVHAFRVRTWGGFVLYLLGALLRGFTGYVLIRYPAAGAVAITLIIAFFFIVGGVFRAAGATALRLPLWGWTVLSGVVSFVLGVALLAQMPVSAVWFIGVVIGVDLIMEGISLIGLATALHRVPRLSPAKAA